MLMVSRIYKLAHSVLSVYESAKLLRKLKLYLKQLSLLDDNTSKTFCRAFISQVKVQRPVKV